MRYAAGQVWTYHHRPGEDGSRLTVLRVETEPGHDPFVHVAVGGLAVRAPQAPAGVVREMGHLPFSADAIDRSVLELVETGPEPPAGDGYTAWRAAFDRGEAGVFTVPVGEVIAMLEQSLAE